jgi:hypothetical protein
LNFQEINYNFEDIAIIHKDNPLAKLGYILNLKDFDGPITLTSNNFEGILLKYTECSIGKYYADPTILPEI